MDATELKYYALIARFPQCPPPDAGCRSCGACRFVFGDADDKRNFTPVAILQPARRFHDDFVRCDSHSLSMLSTRDEAIAFYRSKKEGYPNFQKTIGTHIATGDIDESDGLSTAPDRRGHFSFFEATMSDIKRRFKTIEPLP